jgi:hypothetical protein
MTGAIHEGLDVSLEIRAVEAQRLGDTILLLDGSTVTAFAVCHAGAKTEAGSGSCYVNSPPTVRVLQRKVTSSGC